MRFWVIRHGVIPASRGGKLKTLAQGMAVGMYVLALTGPLATMRFWVMAVAVVLTVVTGLDYVRQAVVLRRAGLAAERQRRGAGRGGGRKRGTAVSDRRLEVLALLAERGETLAVAESLTGGLVAAELTAVPGASRSFRGSVTAYATDLKQGAAGRGRGPAGGARRGGPRGRAADGGRAYGRCWAPTGASRPPGWRGRSRRTGSRSGRSTWRSRGRAAHGKVAALRLNGDRAEIRRESVRSVLELLSGELTRNARAQDTEQNGGN